MKKFLNWAAIAVAILVSLVVFGEASELTRWFVAVVWFVGYCYYQLSKQIQRNHEATERRLDVLFQLARDNAGFPRP